MDQLVLTTGYIEIFYFVPSANIEEFTISEVTGQGQLADFSADATGSIKGTKPTETALVQIIGMEQR